MPRKKRSPALPIPTLSDSERRDPLVVLYHVGLDIASQLELGEVLRRIIQHATELLKADQGGAIYLYDEKTQTLEAVEGIGLGAKYPRIRQQVGEGLTGKAFASGKTTVVEDYAEYEYRLEDFAYLANTSIMIVPIRWQDKLLGTFDLLADKTRHTFGINDVWLAELFAGQAAIAIANAQLYQSERVARARATLLFDATRSLSNSLDLNSALSNLLAQSRQVIPHVTGSVMLYRSNQLEVAALQGFEGREDVVITELRPLLKDNPIYRQMQAERRPIIIEDVHKYPGWGGLKETPHIKSWLGLPLIVRDRLIGMLTLDSDKINGFTANHVESGELLAAQAAIAIDNALLFEETRSLQERFRDMAVSASDWLWEVDAEGILIYCSDSIEESLGYTSAEVIGQSVFTHCQPEDRARFRAEVQQRFSAREPLLHLEGWFQHRDGHPVCLRLSARPMLDRSENMIGYRGASMDITLNKEMAQLEQLAYELAQHLSEVLSTHELARVIVNRLRDAFGYYHVTLWRLDSEQRELVIEEGTGVDLILRAQHSAIDLDARPSLVARAARIHEPVISNNVEIDPHYLFDSALPHTQAEMALPLMRGDKMLGLLDIQSDRINAFGPGEARLLQNIATQAAIALDNARLYADLEMQANMLEELVQHRTRDVVNERERLRAIVGNAGEGIIVTTDQGRIEYINPAFERITGRSSDSIVGMMLSEFLIMDSVEQSTRFDSIMEGGLVWSTELRARRPDGSEYDAALTIAPVTGRDNEIINLVGVLRDITSPRQADRIRNKFVANVSHELRTPITNIKLYHTLLQSTDKAAQRFEYLKVMGEQINRLESLVEDLLQISRLDRGIIALKLQPIYLNMLIESVLVPFAPRLLETDIRLITDFQPELPVIQVDATRIAQVITNLVSNAIHYTPQGGTLTIQTRETQSRSLPGDEIIITDTGIGIESEDIPFIFDRFYRSEHHRDTIPGTGLGLSIVKEIVDLHRGSIRVESSPGVGSTFTVFLPGGMIDDEEEE
jgi:two-component system phosphate regulon sensor histidine kinase PhoR